MSYIDKLHAQIAEELEFSSLQRCSRWTEKVRVMGGDGKLSGPWTFNHHPWLLQVHDDNSELIIIQKGAQMGFTEYALNRTLFTLDQLKRNVLYALPNERPDAMAFSKGRINAASDLSPYINNLFAIAKGEGHKVTNAAVNLYIRGAKSRVGFKQVDVGLVVLDELDEMGEEAIGLAERRLDGQETGKKQLIMLSTPSVEGVGINAQYDNTTQDIYHFPCPSCSRLIHLSYPECLHIAGDSLTDPRIVDSFLKCPQCAAKLPHEGKAEYLKKGQWVSTYPDRPIRGYHINQLYSTQLTAQKLAYYEISGRYSIAKETEFYNSSLGMTFAAKGAKITDKMLNDAQKDYLNESKKDTSKMLITLGADVGQSQNHVAIIGWVFDPSTKTRDLTVAAEGRLLYYCTVPDFAGINDLIQKWRPKKVVVDAQPETKNAMSLAKKYKGVAYACYYTNTSTAKQITIRQDDCSISVNRTFWIDGVFDKFRTKTLDLPRDIDMDFRKHLKSTVKKYSIDDKGNTVSEFVKRENEDDHYLHALTYALLGVGLVAGNY